MRKGVKTPNLYKTIQIIILGYLYYNKIAII